MTNSETLSKLASQLDPRHDVSEGKWFGKPCLKVGKKVFMVQWDQDLVFKLTGENHTKALQIDGAQLFDPRGTGSAMKEWVHVPGSQSSSAPQLAAAALDYVSSLA